jgi:RNA polymerase sigma factor (sigma-70 family)
MSSPSDHVVSPELIRAAQAGDSLAMSKMLDALTPWVGRICGSIALDSGPDATQEALIQVFRDLRGLREPAAFRGWVRRIATREAVRHAQRDRRSFEMADGREPPVVEDPALAADIRSVLESMSPEQRAILVLRDLEGLSEEEAASQLAVAKGTAKSRLHRARSAFQKRWSS